MGDAVDDLNRQAAARPEGFAFRDAHGTITYEGLAQRVAGLAADLEDRPKTIGILAPNGIDWVVADLACKLAA
ncbi:MAG TPA: AMP-binding protein, partial [Rhodospirillaceae bacterium]|nr:AMP-binding protein [Rhodospirillaceae bacterium]